MNRTERDQSVRLAGRVIGDQVERLPVPTVLALDGRSATPQIPRDLGAAEGRLHGCLLVLVPHQRPAQRVPPEHADTPASVTRDLTQVAGASQVVVARLDHT